MSSTRANTRFPLASWLCEGRSMLSRAVVSSILGAVELIYNLSTQQVEVVGSGVQVQHQLHRAYEAITLSEKHKQEYTMLHTG